MQTYEFQIDQLDSHYIIKIGIRYTYISSFTNIYPLVNFSNDRGVVELQS